MARWLMGAFLIIALALPGAAAEKSKKGAANKSSIQIHGGYITGSEYLDMTGLQKKFYVSGLLEGLLLAPAFGGQEKSMKWFLDCTQRLGRTKIRRGIFRYINARTDLWDNRNPAKMFRAIRQVCLDHFKGAVKKGGATSE